MFQCTVIKHVLMLFVAMFNPESNGKEFIDSNCSHKYKLVTAEMRCLIRSQVPIPLV